MENTVVSGCLGNLSVFTTGYEKCAPRHSFSAVFSDRFLIHYILSGKGIFRCLGKEYNLSAGNAFFIGSEPGYYEADKDEPWTYVWVNFSGKIASEFVREVGLNCKEPVYTTNDPQTISDCFNDILGASNLGNEYLKYGCFFKLLGSMVQTNAKDVNPDGKSAVAYVERCIEYIQSNYYRNITTRDVCSFISLEYSYLCRLFRQTLHTSPGRYIIDCKLREAERLLRVTRMHVTEIACVVGYSDRIVFTKAFEKKYGKSPTRYRNDFFSEKANMSG